MTRDPELPAASPVDAHAYVEEPRRWLPRRDVVTNVVMVLVGGVLVWLAVDVAGLPLLAALVGSGVVVVAGCAVRRVSRRRCRRPGC